MKVVVKRYDRYYYVCSYSPYRFLFEVFDEAGKYLFPRMRVNQQKVFQLTSVEEKNERR